MYKKSPLLLWSGHKSGVDTGEIFFGKINVFNLEGSAVQISQGASIGGKSEGQLIGIQRLIFPVKPLVQFSVFAVTQKGVSRVGKLGTDLVGSACDQFALHQTESVCGG